MTLNGVIAITSPNLSVISPNSVAFGTDYIKVVEDTPILSAAEMKAKECSFSDILFIAIFAEVTENECVMENRRQITERNINYIYLLSLAFIFREPHFRIG